MKRIVLVSIFACALGAVSLHAMEYEFPVKESSEKKAPLEKRVSIQLGTITNKTNRLLKNITFENDIDPTKNFTVRQLRPNETAKLYKGPLSMVEEKEVDAPISSIQKITISNETLGLRIFLWPHASRVYASIDNRLGSDDQIDDIDFSKKVSVQVNLILRDGPNGEPLAGSYVELLAGQE